MRRRLGPSVALVALVVLVALAAVLAVRAARMASSRPAPEAIAPAPVDLDGALARLRAGLRLETISRGEEEDAAGDAGEGGAPADRDHAAAFRALHEHLARSYPLVHAHLTRERVAGLSLLYRWAGADPDAPAVVLLAHQDVVPIDEGTEGDWRHPPFEAVVSEGFVWGRGALDDKTSLFATLEAVEGLLAEGFTPAGDVHLAFGHDEELGGTVGAATIARRLADRGTRVGLVLDEGGAIFDGVLPGMSAPVAAVGIAEKGYLSVALEVEGGGGHSSTPPSPTAIGRLATAIVRLEGTPLPSRLDGAVRAFFEQGIGPESGFGFRLVYANLWLFGPVLRAVLSEVPGAGAMIRTTTAPTIVHAGLKDNVLPARARAVVNFRVLPGDSTEDVLDHVRRVVDDEGVRLVALPKRREPSAQSSLDGPGWRVLSRTIGEVFPDAVVAPYLLVAGTDSRHFAALCDCVYRFLPVRLQPEDMLRAHGTDERLAVDQIPGAVRFYRRLLENASAR